MTDCKECKKLKMELNRIKLTLLFTLLNSAEWPNKNLTYKQYSDQLIKELEF